MLKINISSLILQPIEDDAQFDTQSADYYEMQLNLDEPVQEERLEKLWRSVEEDLESDPLWWLTRIIFDTNSRAVLILA